MFEALGHGEALGDALERAQTLESDFDVGAALRQLVELRVLTTLRVPHVVSVQAR
jgi:hypothetical protein